MLPGRRRLTALVMVIPVLAGCHEYFIHDADRQVHQMIAQRQQAALGETHSADLGPEHGLIGSAGRMYDFVPHPLDSTVPEAFRPRPSEPAAASQPTTTASQPATSQPAGERRPFPLHEALAYAMRDARDFQFQKEELYLTALALSLERFLWTPQFVAEVSAEFADYGQVRDFDRAMTAVAEVSASQRLPYGGEVTARVINTLMRDLGVHTTSGETGQFILEADIPLFRGAGRVAYESRYQAERNLIYAVRDFERFRREFVVQVASNYFNLLNLKAQIENARESVKNFEHDLARSRALAEDGRILRIEAERAQVELLFAQNDLVTAQVTYENSLDRFKILIGMPTETPIEAVPEDVNLVDPQVSEEDAIAAALRYRLDLLNDLDAVDDARRQVVIARNNLLPDFNLHGSVTLDTDPNRKNSVSYNTERTTWRGDATLEIPLQRLPERNEYRSTLIDLRRAERNYDLGKDQVRQDVRNALRDLEQARFSMEIQRRNIEVNAFRRELAREVFEKGKLTSNRDVVEAENAFRSARNRFAQAESEYRAAILAFLRDTGTLRVADDGRWVGHDSLATGQSPPAGSNRAPS
jgi:outer membrane protein TolC